MAGRKPEPRFRIGFHCCSRADSSRYDRPMKPVSPLAPMVCPAARDGSAAGELRSPLVGTHVPNVLREEPSVAFQVLNSVLPLAIFGLV